MESITLTLLSLPLYRKAQIARIGRALHSSNFKHSSTMNYLGSTKSLANLPEADGYTLQQRDIDLMDAIIHAKAYGTYRNNGLGFVTGAVIKVADAEIKEIWLTRSSFPYSLECQYICYFQAQ